MSDAVAELATRWHVADPKPAHCSGCFCSAGPDVVFYTPDSAINRGSFVDANGAFAVLDSMDWLHLCATIDSNGAVVGGCVAQLLECSAYRPDLHRRQLNEIKRLEVENAHWKATCRRLKGELDQQIESGLGEPPRTRRR